MGGEQRREGTEGSGGIREGVREVEKEGEQRERERGQREGRSEGGRGGKSKEGGGLEEGGIIQH